MRHDEPRNRASVRVGCHQCERCPVAHVLLEFALRIGDSWRKAVLIHAPELIKVLWLEIADDEGHAAIVAGPSAGGFQNRKQAREVTGFPQPTSRIAEKIAIVVYCPLAPTATSDVPSASEDCGKTWWDAF